ncbi:MAG: MoxR family ATPase, partial [Verrucomicrobiota bacterium]
TLAKALATSISDCVFKRVQFTPDLLPSDILGVSILDPRTQEFVFHHGSIFTNVLLADEVNRASPRTQAALLESMAEEQVTIEGNAYKLKDLFFVIATQNPVEFRGTYPLPEAQMDRFAMQLSLGYVDPEDEVSILASQQGGHPVDSLEPCITLTDLLRLRASAEGVRVSEELMRYIVDLVGATRDVPEVQLAASPRASLALMKTAKVVALFQGMAFVTPEHVRDLAADVIAHRLVLEPQARFSGVTGKSIVHELLQKVPVPG